MAGEKEEKKPKEKWIVSEVPTQTAPMAVNTETKEAYPNEAALTQILNNQEKIISGIKELLQ